MLLILLGLAYLVTGGFAVARNRPRWMPLWLTGLAAWGTVCKYLICTRCERFAQPCDFCYGGKYAALLFKAQPDRTPGVAGMAAEGSSGAVLQLMPVLAARDDRRLLAAFLVTLGAFQWWLLKICCRKCVAHSLDPWKSRFCPGYRIARMLYGTGPAGGSAGAS